MNVRADENDGSSTIISTDALLIERFGTPFPPECMAGVEASLAVLSDHVAVVCAALNAIASDRFG